MANNNKNKGKTFERAFASHLSTVFLLSFQRQPSSGAFTGGKNIVRVGKMSKEQELLHSGDIICPIELAHIEFECKFYKEFAWSSLFDSNAILDKWIAQASSSGKMWFLVFKINRTGEFVVYDTKYSGLCKPNGAGSFLYQDRFLIQPMKGFFELNSDTLLLCRWDTHGTIRNDEAATSRMLDRQASLDQISEHRQKDLDDLQILTQVHIVEVGD